jgi:hypothetical protein
MANLIRNTAKGDARNESSISSPHPLLSSSKTRAPEKTDDVIITLSDAYENRRARQVGEWERLYTHNVYRGV